MKKLFILGLVAVLLVGLGSLVSANGTDRGKGTQVVWIVATPSTEWVAYTKEAMLYLVGVYESQIVPDIFDCFNPSSMVKVTKETWFTTNKIPASGYEAR